jgi:hypothetical protein
MKTYNHALDFTVLALDSLRQGKGVLAARLLAKAVKQPDIEAAIQILEASNKHAFSLQASASKAASPKARIKASEEMSEIDEASESAEPVVDDAPEVEDEVFAEFGEDDNPLDDVPDDEDAPLVDAPGVEMAKVLSSMVRRTSKK